MHVSPESQREMLRQMLTIRRFEERASADYLAGKIYGVVHCYIGEEAVAVGVCSALGQGDRIISTHRGHGHCIAKGADLNRMMAELYGRQTGYCKGKGGSMHIADFGIGMLGANGIVAGGISIVTGAGLAAQMEGKGGVAVSFFGDGASNAGPFHECLNIAATWKLPMLYVCENNLYAAQTAAAADACPARRGGPRRRLRHPGRGGRRQRRVRGLPGGEPGRGPGALRRRPDPDRVQDVPLAGPYRAPRPARPARSRRDGGTGMRTRDPIALLERATRGTRRSSTTLGCRRSRARSWPRSNAPSPLPRRARSLCPKHATDDVFAATMNASPQRTRRIALGRSVRASATTRRTTRDSGCETLTLSQCAVPLA